MKQHSPTSNPGGAGVFLLRKNRPNCHPDDAEMELLSARLEIHRQRFRKRCFPSVEINLCDSNLPKGLATVLDNCFQLQPDVSSSWGRRLGRGVPARLRNHGPNRRGTGNIIPLPGHEKRSMGTMMQTNEALRPRHPALVRVTHWLITLSFLALLVTGVEILISHPRFYWGETGNVNTRAWFKLPIPSSRGAVPTGYGYVLPDQNGWSRYLHFEAAWVAVFTGLLYGAFGFFRGHFRQNLLPAPSDLSPTRLAMEIGRHLRFRRPSEEEAWSYNVLQRLTYLLRHFRSLSFGHLDGPGHVPGHRLGVSGCGHAFGRSAVRTHSALLRIHSPGALSFGSRFDGFSCRIPEAGGRHDHRPPYLTRERT